MSDLPNVPTRPQPLSEAEIIDWLDYVCEPLFRRREEIVPVLLAMAQHHPTVSDETTAGAVAENLRIAGRLADTADDDRQYGRVAVKRPFLEGGRTVDAWFRRFRAPLESAMVPLSEALTDYMRRKAAEERKRAQEEAERAAMFSKEQEEARRRAEGKAADLSRVEGDYGAVASLRTTWDYEVEDIRLVPSEFLMIDAARVREYLRFTRDPRTRKPTSTIPGIRWVERQSVGVR